MASITPAAAAAWSSGSGFQPISFEDSLLETNASEVPSEVNHAVHCLIWARDPTPLLGLDKDKSRALHPRAAVLMHVRFDGMFGFPGGKIDDPVHDLPLELAKAVVTASLTRELVEESNYDTRHSIAWYDYMFTHRYTREITGKPIYAHFFAHELELDELRELEKRSLASHEHGREVKGNVRVPLYTMSDGYRGLPAFLDNNFIGNARGQLLEAVVQLGFLQGEEMELAAAATLRR